MVDIMLTLREKNEEKTTVFGQEDSTHSPRQCNGAHFSCRYGEIHWIRLHIAPVPPYSPVLTNIDLSKLEEEMAWWKEILP